jgi:hypothetical protein
MRRRLALAWHSLRWWEMTARVAAVAVVVWTAEAGHPLIAGFAMLVALHIAEDWGRDQATRPRAVAHGSREPQGPDPEPRR